tara:strand:- start:38 stop:898 length:861 start_codon:yes stop_codon:yes gene_type:complete
MESIIKNAEQLKDLSQSELIDIIKGLEAGRIAMEEKNEEKKKLLFTAWNKEARERREKERLLEVVEEKEEEIKKWRRDSCVNYDKLNKSLRNANNLRKYKFQCLKLKSEIRALKELPAKQDRDTPNLFQMLREKDYDAYLYLESFLLPVSYANRMEKVHRSIIRPQWFVETNHASQQGSSEGWIQMVRQPRKYKSQRFGDFRIYSYRSNSECNTIINIHGIKFRSKKGSSYYNEENKQKLEYPSPSEMTKEHIVRSVKNTIGLEMKESWNKAKIWNEMMKFECSGE